MQDRSAIMAQIRHAFHHVTMKGNGPTLREADVIRQYGPAATNRAASARALDNDKRWWQISDASFDKAINPFPHLDNLAFLYYLPPIMTWCLKQSDKAAAHSLFNSLIAELTMPTRWDLVDAKRKRFEAFNHEQSTVIAQFLNYWISQGIEVQACEAAIASYWKQFQR